MLTTAKVRDLKPKTAMYEVTCAAMPGFIVRVLPTGKKVFVVRYRVDGKDRRERLGLWGPDLTVEEARRQAVLRASGADPSPPAEPVAPAPRAARSAPRTAVPAPPKAVPEPRAEPVEPRRSRATVRELADRFIREYVDVYLKDRTAVNYRHCMNDVIVPALGDREFDTITRRDAQALHAGLRAKPSAADYALSVLGSFYTRILIDWEMSEMRNPTHAIKRFGSHKRERFLAPEERRRLREVMDAGLRTPSGKPGHIEPVSAWALQLLAMTGLRRDEIRQLTWPSIDWQHGQLRLHDTKTGPRTVTISSQVIALLKEIHDRRGNPRSGRVVPSRTGNTLRSLNTTWLRLREAAGIPDVRLHDLRHSFASDALMGGVPLAIVGEMLGHRQPSTTKRYAHLADNVVRQAVEHTTGRIVEAERTVTAALSPAPYLPLRDAQWTAVAPLVGRHRGAGGLPVNLRAVIDGIRWVLHTHGRWRDIPETYAASTTCWRWYKRWCDEGTWEKIETRLA